MDEEACCSFRRERGGSVGGVRGGGGNRSKYFYAKDVPFANYVEAKCMAQT